MGQVFKNPAPANNPERYPQISVVFHEQVRLTSELLLTPVVDHIGIGPIESIRMRTLHGDTLHGHSISVGAHAPVSIFTSQVNAGLQSRSARGRKTSQASSNLSKRSPAPPPPRAAPNLT